MVLSVKFHTNSFLPLKVLEKGQTYRRVNPWYPLTFCGHYGIFSLQEKSGGMSELAKEPDLKSG